RLSYGGASLIPAWALISSGKLAVLPVLPDVQRITVLVDHDLNGEGQAAAERLERAWGAANRTVLRLLPDNPGDDFNDIVLRGRLFLFHPAPPSPPLLSLMAHAVLRWKISERTPHPEPTSICHVARHGPRVPSISWSGGSKYSIRTASPCATRKVSSS